MDSEQIKAYCRSELDRLVPPTKVWPTWTRDERDLVATLMAAMFADGISAGAKDLASYLGGTHNAP